MLHDWLPETKYCPRLAVNLNPSCALSLLAQIRLFSKSSIFFVCLQISWSLTSHGQEACSSLINKFFCILSAYANSFVQQYSPSPRNCQSVGLTTPFICCSRCVHAHTDTHYIRGGTLNPSHLSTDSSALSAHPCIRGCVCITASLKPLTSHRAGWRELDFCTLLSTSHYCCFTRVLSQQYLFQPKGKNNKIKKYRFFTGCISKKQNKKHAHIFVQKNQTCGQGIRIMSGELTSQFAAWIRQ